jgi:diacylglycerol kinase family enzyme
MMSVGITTQTLERVKENRVLEVMGKYKYFIATIWETIRHMYSLETIRASFNSQGWAKFENLYIFAAGRSKYFGGGQKICPYAEVDGHQLDVCILNDMELCDMFLKLPFDIKHGSHSKYSLMTKVSNLEICAAGEKDICVELDGDIVGKLPVRIDCSQDVNISIACYPS